MVLKNDRLLRALNLQPVDRPPVWLMRQAGRYLPEYRAVRKKAGDFMQLCRNPELACEVTLQPVERYPLDAAIIFSDILTIPDAMGLGLYFTEGKGPQFAQPLREAKQIENLPIPDPEQSLGYVMDAIRLTRQQLNNRIPLIGFSGSPWTLATYMVEGGASRTFSIIKRMLYREPALLHRLLDKLAKSIVLYLRAQIAAGAQVLMLFDTWGGALSGKAYIEFSLHYMQKIIQGLKLQQDKPVPIILFTKNGGTWLESMAKSGCNAVGLDWQVDLAQAYARVGGQVALQGNLDPAILYAQPDVIVCRVADLMRNISGASGYIFNLGHGIPQDADPEHVAALIEAVHGEFLT